MQVRAVRIESSPRETLAEGWSIRAAEPGEFTSPDVLPAEGWQPIATLATVAACEREAGRWSLDRSPVRSFDTQDWWYRLAFDLPEPTEVPLRLCFDGLATLAEVWLNGQSILTSDNMFVAHVCELVPGQLRESDNELVMRFRSLDQELARRRPRPAWRVPMLEQQQLRWVRTTLLGRTPGWSPPAPPIGPWREIRLERAIGARLETRQLRAALDGADGVLDVVLAFEGSELPADVSVELFAPGDESAEVRGALTADGSRWGGRLRISAPALWWPHTHGTPALYRARAIVRLRGGAEASMELGNVGFRSVELDTDADAFALRINGTSVFCRGACWTPADPIGFRADPGALRRLLEEVRDAGMNMLRVGGTMVYEDEAFFDACDALGIMVWQEFMFANMDYPSADASFLASVEHELRQQMTRWGGRACLAVVCGNSEVSQQAAMWGAQRGAWSPALFHEIVPALARQCLPDVPYWPSSAWGGAFPHQVDAGSTSYYGVGAYLRPLDDARRSGLRFATECLGFSNVPAPHTIDRMPGGSALRVTHAAWKARASRDLTAGWDFEDVRDHYLGELFGVDATRLRYSDHERYLALSRATSGEVMIAAFSEWRRRGSPCGGALVWFLRDLWAGAGWGVLDDAGLPKPCWHALKRVLQPLAVLLTDEGNNGLVAHVVNERPEPLVGLLTLDAWRGDVLLAHAEGSIEIAPRTTIERNVASMLDHFIDLSDAFRFGRRAHDAVVLSLTSAAGERLGQAFHFPGGMGLPMEADLGLTAQARPLEGGSVEVRVSSRRFALGVHFETPGYVPSDEFFHLPPRQEALVVFRPLPGARTWRGVVSALNSAQPGAISSAG